MSKATSKAKPSKARPSEAKTPKAAPSKATDGVDLTRIGPGTPMGEMMRQYWIPAAASTELPEQDGPPLRVRLLGEDLIAFRDTNGRIGLVAANCPHRGASLFFGRNEEDGLRCV